MVPGPSGPDRPPPDMTLSLSLPTHTLSFQQIGRWGPIEDLGRCSGVEEDVNQ